MNLVELFKRTRTGVVQVLHVRNNAKIGFGSGFFINGQLVTNYHVASAILAPQNAKDSLAIRFHDDPENHARWIVPASEFAKRLKGSSEEHSFDYLLADFPEALSSSTYQFEFAPLDQPLVGQFVAFQGYPFGQASLASHAGYVSSIHPSGVATMIQLDANVNSGNSGGPLFDVATGEVLGVISRKQTGLSDLFDQLISSFEGNIRVLTATGGASMSIGGIDPVKVLAMTQRQLSGIAQEIKRSANVGIGFAVKATALRDEPALNS